MSCLEMYFGNLPDPRADNVSHRLSDLIVMMVAASLCGASCATEFALFAETRKDVLRRLIDYDLAPSHDTFSRVLRMLDPTAFSQAFSRFAGEFAMALEQVRPALSQTGDVVAIDGKALRRAYETGCAASPALMVSAFAAHSRLCLAAVMPGDGSNEIEAALNVVELLDLTNKTVTADALHCHHRMAETVVSRGGDYVLALKGNRRLWLEDAITAFANGKADRAETTENNHGRDEWRLAEVIPAQQPLMHQHAAFARITAKRGSDQVTTRYFMLSKTYSPKQVLEIVRSHWLIENCLHWVLDVHLDEDLNRARKDNAAANIGFLKRIARNILQTVENNKTPISHRIKKCAWQDSYLTHALTHMR